LAAADEVVTERILTLLSHDVPPSERARWMEARAVTLAHRGKPAEALPLDETVVEVRRALAEADDRFRPDLARSLGNLGVRYGQVGRPADAISVVEESVAIRRELVATDAARHLPGLAMSLNSLGTRYADAGRYEDALRVTEESVAIRRTLATADPG